MGDRSVRRFRLRPGTRLCISCSEEWALGSPLRCPRCASSRVLRLGHDPFPSFRPVDGPLPNDGRYVGEALDDARHATADAWAASRGHRLPSPVSGRLAELVYPVDTLSADRRARRTKRRTSSEGEYNRQAPGSSGWRSVSLDAPRVNVSPQHGDRPPLPAPVPDGERCANAGCPGRAHRRRLIHGKTVRICNRCAEYHRRHRHLPDAHLNERARARVGDLLPG